MDEVTIDWSRMADITRALSEMSRNATDTQAEVLTQAADLLHQSWAGYTPSKSGTAAAQWGTKGPYPSPGGMAIQVGPTAPYARRLELGYRKQSGRGRQGTSPFHFMKSGLTDFAPRMSALLSTVWNPRRLKGGGYG